MDPLSNINNIHVQAKTNAIIIVIYHIYVLYTCMQVKRVDKDFGPLINEISPGKYKPLIVVRIHVQCMSSHIPLSDNYVASHHLNYLSPKPC